ncbi:MAG: response regulator [Anaerolineae bacterium]
MWLLAEDEADIRNLLAMMIQVWGHQPVAYENGQKVWDWLDRVETEENGHPLPELVLMDIRMPGKRGNELANRMRTIPALKKVPIVLMTAFSLSDGERHQMMDEDGVDHILSKPLPDFDQLQSILLNIRDQKKNGN